MIGQPPDAAERAEMLDAARVTDPAERARLDALLATDSELPALIHALDGGYIRPAPGGDLLRTTDVLPTGRNLHGFDPFRLPSAFAVQDGARQADRLLARHAADGKGVPETVAMVLWGTDNLKTEGGPIAQALWLMGATPRFDSYGRLCGAALLPLIALGRPRVDVVITLSGIFRDLLPLQTKLLAEAALLAASADEPPEQNFVRKHALAYQAQHGGTLEVAALRVFGNADGAYGSNVNALVGSGMWNDEDEFGRSLCRAQRLRLRRVRPAGAPRGRAGPCPGQRRDHLPEPRLGGAGRHHRGPLPSIRWAASPARCAGRAAGRRPACISAIRPAATAPSAACPSRCRWKPAPGR